MEFRRKQKVGDMKRESRSFRGDERSWKTAAWPGYRWIGRKRRKKKRRREASPKGQPWQSRFRLGEWNCPGNRWLLISVWRSISQEHRLRSAVWRLRGSSHYRFPWVLCRPTTTRPRFHAEQQARSIIILLSSKRQRQRIERGRERERKIQRSSAWFSNLVQAYLVITLTVLLPAGNSTN